ncbi:MAG: tRNA pseudouridine(38-40) synthase TruA [Planctomycetota bacterium]
MKRNIKLIIEYDGTNYCGWQIQKNDRTIQAEITKALEKMTRHKVTLYGASRTDSGVHALGQVANFYTTGNLDPARIQNGLNGLLDDDIVIKESREVPDRFNAQYDAKAKTYIYRMLNGPVPSALQRNYYYFNPQQVSVPLMRKAARFLKGRHDFRAFANHAGSYSDSIRRICDIRIIKKHLDGVGQEIRFTVTGNGFLYNMVRNIVGTLLLVGYKKIAPEAVKYILKSKDRARAGQNVPAKGLCLVKVEY